jgi:hypothetical protein
MSEQYRTLLSFMRDIERGALFFYGLQERGKKNTTRSAVVVATRHLSSFVNSFLCRRIKFSHKNPQLFHKVAAVTVRTELSGEPRLASAARYLFSS